MYVHLSVCFMPSAQKLLLKVTGVVTHTHTYNRFTAFLEFVQDYLGEQVPERVKPIWIYWARDSEWQWHLLGYRTLIETPMLIVEPLVSMAIWPLEVAK